MPSLLTLVLTLIFAMTAAPALGLDASCGMTVPEGETAILQADLTCAGSQIAITLARKATLDLNGFTLTVGEDMIGVFCAEYACTVISSVADPGVLEGGSLGYYGLISNLQPDGLPPIRKLLIDNVEIRNFENAGMYAAFYGKSRLSRLTVTGCGGPGIIGKQMILSDVTANGNGLIADLSNDGIVASKITGENVTTNGNAERGIFCSGPVKLTGLTATGNGTFGVDVRALNLKDSQLSVSGTADIRSIRHPRLKNTSCEHSNWFVCSLD